MSLRYTVQLTYTVFEGGVEGVHDRGTSMTHPVRLVDWQAELVEGVVRAKDVHAQEGLKVLIGIDIELGVVGGQLLIVEHLVRIADVSGHAVQLLLGLLLGLGVHPDDLVQDVVEDVADVVYHLQGVGLRVLMEVLADIERSHGYAKTGMRFDNRWIRWRWMLALSI